jgi:hypothetical protein
MLALGAAATIQGVSGTATAITHTITGDEVTTGDAFKKLAQGQLPTVAGALYTVPASTSALVRSISLVNGTGAAATARLFVDGTAEANAIMPTLSIPAGGFALYDGQLWNLYSASGALLLSIPAHGSAEHLGSIFPSPAADQVLGGAYLEFADEATPALPAGGSSRLFRESARDVLSVLRDAGVGFPIALESGIDLLSAGVLGSAAATLQPTPTTFGARDQLLICLRVPSYGSADIASLRFNADAGANYWSRYLSAAAGVTSLTNSVNVSQTLARLFATTTTLGRVAWIVISNRAATSKVGRVLGQTSTNAAGTSGTLEFGGFEWVNTVAQITQVELRTASGNTMGAGTAIAVLGLNYQ